MYATSGLMFALIGSTEIQPWDEAAYKEYQKAKEVKRSQQSNANVSSKEEANKANN